MMMRFVKGTLLFVLVTAQAGCLFNLTEEEFEGQGLLEETEARRTQWEEQDIDDYRFTYVWTCNCAAREAGPFVVTVEDGATASVQYQGAPAPGDPERPYFRIDTLFDFIVDGIQAGPDRISLSFDPERGYPVRVFLDYDGRTGGEEDLVNVTAFEVL